eukprot:TRINITY_DN6940_c0_g2_i1.p1 TRINITY_DN6940_c0_g2~~TRINITY_DN6940_c0_g2_i1.p1  ORF type:complete len:192 (-),score=51.92 TRINITY_DN6940_c0_g2_i1:228-803(-)
MGCGAGKVQPLQWVQFDAVGPDPKIQARVRELKVGQTAATVRRNQQEQQQQPPQPNQPPAVSGDDAALAAAIILVGSLNLPDDPAASFHSYAEDGGQLVLQSQQAEAPSKSPQPSEANAEVKVYVSQECLAQNPRQARPPNRRMHERNIKRVAKFSDDACAYTQDLKSEIDKRRTYDASLLEVELPPGEPI